MTTCDVCNVEMQLVVEDEYHYAESGLPDIVVNNVRVSTCPVCQARVVGIPQVSRLHQTIARALAKKRARLTGPEVRFMRKWLGMSGTDFARAMGVTKETVSRWENNHESMGMTAELFLRHMVRRGKPRESYADEPLSFEPARITVTLTDGRWRATRAN